MRFTGVFLSVFAAAMIGVTVASSVVVAAPPKPSEQPGATASAEAGPTPSTPTPAAIAPAPAPVAEELLPPASLTESFQNALAAFQKNDFKLARRWFRETLSKDGTQIVAWYDLGLTEQKLGNTGLAMAFWRKALALSPTFRPAKAALSYTRDHLDHADIPHEVETWELLRSSILVYAPAWQFALGAVILFFGAGWLLLTYFGSRRRALLDESPLPAPPILASLLTVGFLVLVSLTICKLIDDQDLRATVIVKKSEARALPDPTSTSLFDLYEGLEVIVRQTRKDWIQVTYPGGATGWVPRRAVFTLADSL